MVSITLNSQEEIQEEPILGKVIQRCPLSGADAGHIVGAQGRNQEGQALGWDSSQREAEDTKD